MVEIMLNDRRPMNLLPSSKTLYSCAVRPGFVAIVLLILAAAGLRPVVPALASCGGVTTVGNTEELNEAIEDFNDASGDCDFKIEFENDIILTSAVELVNNADEDVSLTIDGNSYSLDGNWNYIAFVILETHDVVIEDLTITHSLSDGIESDFSNLILSRVSIQHSESDGLVFADGYLKIVDSSFIGNLDSGIEVYGEFEPSDLFIVNSTIANNVYTGLSVVDSYALVTHVTFARNNVALEAQDSEVTVYNSILTESRYEPAGDCTEGDGGDVVFYFSLVGSVGNCGEDAMAGNIYGENALLGLLGDYGGPTRTIPLLSLTGSVTKSSPAIDAGSNALSRDENDETLEFDQRGPGYARNVNGTVDMGAFEGALEFECSTSMSVDDEVDLAAAIYCFNNAEAGDYTIEFENDITLTSHMIAINNDSEDVSLTIDGAGYMLNGDSVGRPITIYETEDVTIDHLTITHSYEDGIESFHSNLRLSRSTVQRSQYNGIDFSSGELTVIESALLYSGEDGLFVYGMEDPTQVYVINSTAFGNNTDGFDFRGGTTTLTHVTSAGNWAGLYMDEAGVTVNNSILADNVYYDCDNYNSTLSISYSLVGSSHDCDVAPEDGNILGENPLLGPLDNYGGPTLTLPLASLSGNITDISPAVNSGSDDLSKDEFGQTLTVDQRGEPRKVGPAVDMGAYEGLLEVDCDFPMTAADEDEFNLAIYCFNALNAAGVYTIELEDDIDLTRRTTIIDNPTGGVSLVIEGYNHTIDGQNNEGVRPITINYETTVTLRSMTLTGGNPQEDGGGIENRGTLTIENVRVEYNTSVDDGGGIFTEAESTTEIIDSSINNNYAADSGGGIDAEGDVTITRSTISDNHVGDGEGSYGGGIFNEARMTIVRSIVANNSMDVGIGYGSGGGIANVASLTIRDSSIYGNSITSSFGYIYGGGIANMPDSDIVEVYGHESLLIINSTISGNTLNAIEGAYGGGIYGTGLLFIEISNPITVALINTTVADNSIEADSEYEGAGAYFEMFESEFSENEFEVTIHNSILAGNQLNEVLNDCVLYAEGPLAFYSHNSLYEATGDSACGLPAANANAEGNIVGEDPLLGDLGDNGGLTPTHLPDELSPAVNAGHDDLAVDEEGVDLTTDQRGFARIIGSAVDMGSVEVGAAPAAAVYMSATKSGNAGGVAYDNSDILMWDGEDWSKVFDGSAAGLFPENKPKHNTAAFWISGVGQEVIMSFAQNGRKVGDLPGKIDGMDLVRWDGSAFSLYFDGSDVGLTQKTPEKIDGLHVLPGSAAPDDFGGGCVAWLLISTQGPAKVPAEGGGQLKVGGEDVLGFCATNLGQDTAGFWRLVVDGSAVGLKKNAVDSLSVSDDGETIYMTMKKAVNSPVVAGHSMIIAYDMNSETFYGPLFKAADYSLTQKVDGLQVVGEIEAGN